ncbi:DUF3822 family protein [Lutibacter sp. HS1-25]|uniref:DUF3822 family protein n=1 Tax=Lutibacter sp. HS1-25 TaxID=2485000 RepID=UPI001011F880|nr:DUF3822 family protein [Lutibacter sp. HS1-25]RXP57626.1 DUF3822 family protein [Lutibacter sp. HS1-25]
MITKIKKKTNNQIDYKNLEENHLSIQLSLDGFSFCIYNKAVEEFGAIAIYKFEGNTLSPFQHLEMVEELFKKEELLKINYKSVSVSHFNNLVSQVPLPFFEKENLADYLQYSVKVLENDYITYDQLYNSEIVNVYIPFVNINNFFIDCYGSFEFKHSSTIFIEKLLQEFKHATKDCCFINVTGNNFEIAIFTNKKLQLFNCFTFKTKEDFIYYILFTAEQLNLNPEELKVVLLGDIEEKSDLYAILFQYIRNIEFYKPQHFSSFLKETISAHSNFTLLNQI